VAVPVPVVDVVADVEVGDRVKATVLYSCHVVRHRRLLLSCCHHDYGGVLKFSSKIVLYFLDKLWLQYL